MSLFHENFQFSFQNHTSRSRDPTQMDPSLWGSTGMMVSLLILTFILPILYNASLEITNNTG